MDSKIRYTVTFDAYIYAENDYKAKIKANEIVRLIEQLTEAEQTQVKELHMTPFATLIAKQIPL